MARNKKAGMQEREARRARGPLESLTLKDHCEMCGAKKRLEPAFDPSGKPKTLCFDCRIGSAELLAGRRVKPYVLVQVSGGVAEIGINEGAEVDILDYDNLKQGSPAFENLSDRERAYVLEHDGQEFVEGLKDGADYTPTNYFDSKTGKAIKRL